MPGSPWTRIAGSLARLAVREGPRVLREVRRRRDQSSTPRRAGQQCTSPTAKGATVRPGPPRPSAEGSRLLEYRPDLDGRADPGEIVWTWVAYEEDDGRGKDRPVLVVGRSGQVLHGLMLSSQDEHEGDPGWVGLGSGAWDVEGRPSWVRLDRVLDVGEDSIRREGAVLERATFDRVATELRERYGWT